MKSSTEDLIKRGFGGLEDFHVLNEVSTQQLLVMINSKVPLERTGSVIALRKRYCIGDKEYSRLLLEQLSSEKALYTRMEICNSLEMGNEDTAIMMCDYLGVIGKNQHKKVPNGVSLKKSYPLPRDIIARSLGKMDKSVVDVLLRQLETNDSQKASELIDAFGFLIFYNQELAIERYFDGLINIFKRFINNELIIWKIALCCSAFPLVQSISLIEEIREKTKNQTILLETQRSLKLIVSKMVIKN